MKHAFYSTAGRVKPINEDAALLRIASCAHNVRGMLAVCDGVSSLSDSAQASRFVIASLNELFEKWKMQSIRPQKELMLIHKMLYDKGRKDHHPYGTTCSLFMFEDDTYHIFQIGDSRIYLMREKLSLLTVDQTLARMKYDQQTISLEAYCHSHERHVLTQCLGVSMPLQIAQSQGQWQSCDAVLICSDGISNRLRKEVLQEHMKRFIHKEGGDSAFILAKAAMAAGERDNLSAVLFSRCAK